MLTIGIPSYNRPEKLCKLLASLCKQLTKDITIIVVDNASDYIYEEACCSVNNTIRNLTSEGIIKFVRNKNNIGMSANFMRCFELCESEWLWMISDDDDLANDAVQNVMLEIKKFTVASVAKPIYIRFSSDKCKVIDGGRDLYGLNELIREISISVAHFNTFIFITNGLFRVSDFASINHIGYEHSNTYVPHLIMLLHCLSRGESKYIHLSEKQVVKYVVPKIGYSYGFVAGLGVGAFKNFAFNLSKKQYLALEGSFAAHNDYKVLVDLYYYAKFRSNKYEKKILMLNYLVQIRRARGILKLLLLRGLVIFLSFDAPADLMLQLLRKMSPFLNRQVLEMYARYK
ncbi:MAG: glycosyltransferase family 2 protein [Coxiellaceae bacterium]|nr:glycosyltransferase family 2 protein [Coxiellaceae bacterium]